MALQHISEQFLDLESIRNISQPKRHTVIPPIRSADRTERFHRSDTEHGSGTVRQEYSSRTMAGVRGTVLHHVLGGVAPRMTVPAATELASRDFQFAFPRTRGYYTRANRLSAVL
jgi:hypothetical protein